MAPYLEPNPSVRPTVLLYSKPTLRLQECAVVAPALVWRLANVPSVTSGTELIDHMNSQLIPASSPIVMAPLDSKQRCVRNTCAEW
jgi:hypothetical protein